MLAISPLHIVNLYRTTNESYRISAVQRMESGSKGSSSSRQPSNYRFERLDRLGIIEEKDGTWKLDESVLKEKLPGNYDLTRSGLDSGPGRYRQYQSVRATQLQAYLPVPMSGLLLDTWM